MNKVCDENITLKYFAGQLAQNELARAEEHIANCSQCCQTIAQLTKSMFSEETSEEKAFLDSHIIESQLEIRKLIKEALEAKTSSNSNVVSFPAKTTDAKKSTFSLWISSPLALTASLAVILLVGLVAFLMLQNKSSNLDSPSEIAQSFLSLKEINRTGRPTNFRMEGFDYAPPKVRSDNTKEINQKLAFLQRTVEDATSIKPSDKTLTLLAQILITSGKYEQAIKELEKALQLKPKDPALLTNLSVAYAAKEDYQHALAFINQALSVNEKYLPAIFNRALIYKELKQYDNARSDWEKYLILDPNSSWASEVRKISKLDKVK